MHPLFDGENARLRALELAREAAERRRHPHIRPIPVRTSLRQRARTVASRCTGGGLRHAVGLWLIHVGLRIVDPVVGVRHGMGTHTHGYDASGG